MKLNFVQVGPLTMGLQTALGCQKCLYFFLVPFSSCKNNAENLHVAILATSDLLLQLAALVVFDDLLVLG